MIPGWSHPGEFEALAAHASSCPGPWVEIGSYCGRSASFLGAAAVPLGVTVFAVDPHRGNPEMAPGEDCYDVDVWDREHGSLSVLIDTLRDLGLDGTVIPVVGSGDRFAETGIRPGFVFIDADHDYLACLHDFMVWSALLVDGGLICLHDADQAAGPGKVRVDALAAGWRLVEQVRSLAVLAR